MATDPRLRASDEDRDRAAAQLREHHAVGRLDPEEFNDRLDKVYQAKTMGELDEVLADLPAVDLYRLPDAALHGQNRQPVPGSSSLGSAIASRGHLPGRLSPAWRAAWGSWFSVTLVCFVIWAIGGRDGSLWPLWVAGPWGAILLGRWITGIHPRGTADERRRRHRELDGR